MAAIPASSIVELVNDLSDAIEALRRHGESMSVGALSFQRRYLLQYAVSEVAVETKAAELKEPA